LQAEVNYLSQLHHENLVKLIGYCSDGKNRLLVYEFMHKGSLENHLFRSKYYIYSSTYLVSNDPSVTMYKEGVANRQDSALMVVQNLACSSLSLC